LEQQAPQAQLVLLAQQELLDQLVLLDLKASKAFKEPLDLQAQQVPKAILVM
jgi:hypothetical protein